jgi:hypothetical protein
MGLLDRVLRRRPPAAADRRSQLLSHGRITDGVILDSDINSAGDEVVVYMYTLNGVDFESCDILTEDQRRDRLKYAPGAKVGIRYDPRNQGNSIVE